MRDVFDSFWRASLYCLHPRVIALSVLPVLLMAAFSLAIGYFFWEGALSAVRLQLESYQLINAMVRWLDGLGLGRLHLVLAPALILFLAIPAIVVMMLLFVAALMTPSMVALVARKRFAQLERKHGGSFLAGLGRSAASTALAAVLLVVTIPLWLIPPLILVLPPIIWGWLTYRVMSYDALAEHASAAERQLVLQQNRLPLLGIGVVTGYLGAAPSLLWASGAMFVAMAPVLVPVAIWLYTLVFAFSSLWFSHFCLQSLARVRQKNTEFPHVPIAKFATDSIAYQSRDVAALPHQH